MKNSFALRVANLLQLSVLLGVATPAFGYDNGPRVIGCDFRESSTSKQKAEICFIPSSGMQMGYGWIVIRPESTKNYYRLHDNHGAELSEDKRWQKAEILDGQALVLLLPGKEILLIGKGNAVLEGETHQFTK